MNLREFVKKLRSPMGTTILFLSGLVILILLLLPMLLRDDAGKLEVNRPAGGEGTFDINSNIKAVNTPPKKPVPEQKQDKNDVQESDKKSPRPPLPPGRSSNGTFRKSSGQYNGERSDSSNSRKSLITIIDGDGNNAKE